MWRRGMLSVRSGECGGAECGGGEAGRGGRTEEVAVLEVRRPVVALATPPTYRLLLRRPHVPG